MKTVLILSISFISMILSNAVGQTTVRSIDSLYIPDRDLGELFVAVQTAHIFEDSKTFVDCTPLENPAIIYEKYQQQKLLADFSLNDFVHTYFSLPQPIPTAKANEDKDILMHLKTHWPSLVRESKSEDRYTSLISLPYPFVVPGGRFREMFYWDSYFTIIGLLESGQDSLTLGMLRNFSYLINNYGHIPNGNRTYFLSRSQPPFFAEMLKVYAEKFGTKSIIEFLPALEKEYEYWTENSTQVGPNKIAVGKSVWLNGSVLNRYTGTLSTPRAEAFEKELKWAQALPEKERPGFYKHLRAACESGWDFSSRWFKDGKNITTVNCEDLIPVCLNSLLYNVEQQLATMHEFNKENVLAKKYKQLAAKRKEALDKYCWNQATHFYNDYNFVLHNQTDVLSLATVYPLFFGLASQQQADEVAKVIEDSLLMKGGVVTTLNKTGEQWDYPNGWAPLQWLTVMGLAKYGHTKLATTIAKRWLEANETVYNNELRMMEKYNVTNTDLLGGGGNYKNQDGFGWTNGVDIALYKWLETQTAEGKH